MLQLEWMPTFTRLYLICSLPPPMAVYTVFSPSLFLKHTGHTQRGLGTYSQHLEHCSQVASSMAHFITCFRALLTNHLNGEAFPDLYVKLNAPQYTLPCSFSALFFAVLAIWPEGGDSATFLHCPYTQCSAHHLTLKNVCLNEYIKQYSLQIGCS